MRELTSHRDLALPTRSAETWDSTRVQHVERSYHSLRRPAFILSTGIEVDATVALRPPRTIAFLVPPWNDALAFVEREGMKEAHQLGVWLSLYAVPETTTAALRQGLADLQSALTIDGTGGV